MIAHPGRKCNCILPNTSLVIWQLICSVNVVLKIC